MVENWFSNIHKITMKLAYDKIRSSIYKLRVLGRYFDYTEITVKRAAKYAKKMDFLEVGVYARAGAYLDVTGFNTRAANGGTVSWVWYPAWENGSAILLWISLAPVQLPPLPPYSLTSEQRISA